MNCKFVKEITMTLLVEAISFEVGMNLKSSYQWRLKLALQPIAIEIIFIGKTNYVGSKNIALAFLSLIFINLAQIDK